MINQPPASVTRVDCSQCNWSGAVADAICEPKDLVRCPKCKRPVSSVHVEFAKSETVWESKPLIVSPGVSPFVELE